MRVLSDRYVLDNAIATGESVTVWHGTDQVSGDPILVRTYNLKNAEEGVREHLQRETRAVGALRHPNIATVRDQGFDGEDFFTVMERLEGRDLRRLTDQDDPLPSHRAASIRQQVLSALDHARTAGIAHGPVRPENVTVDARDRVQVTLPISPTAPATQAGATADGVSPNIMSATLSALLDSLADATETDGDVPSAEMGDDSQTVWPIPGDRYDPARLGRKVILALIVLALFALTAFILRVTSEVDKRNDDAPSVRLPSVTITAT